VRPLRRGLPGERQLVLVVFGCCRRRTLPLGRPRNHRTMVGTSMTLTNQQRRVLKLIKAGDSQAEVARILGVSRQWISQIVERLRQLGELPEEKAS